MTELTKLGHSNAAHLKSEIVSVRVIEKWKKSLSELKKE